MAVEMQITRESIQHPTVVVPQNFRDGLILNEELRYSLHSKGALNPDERVQKRNAEENISILTAELILWRAQQLAAGNSVEGMTLELGRYSNEDYPHTMPPNEQPNPFSDPKLFISFDREEEGEPPFFLKTSVRKLVKTGRIGHSQEIIENLLDEPDGYRQDSPEQFIDRTCVEIMQINRALDWSDTIINEIQRSETQAYLRALRARAGETLLLLLLDPNVKTPRASIKYQDHPKIAEMQNLRVQIGRNSPVRFLAQHAGPSGIPLGALAERCLSGSERTKYKGRRNELPEIAPKLTAENCSEMLQELKQIDIEFHGMKDSEEKDKKLMDRLNIRREYLVECLLLANKSGTLPDEFKLRTVYLRHRNRTKRFESRIRIEAYKWDGESGMYKFERYEQIAALENMPEAKRIKMIPLVKPFAVEEGIRGRYRSPDYIDSQLHVAA